MTRERLAVALKEECVPCTLLHRSDEHSQVVTNSKFLFSWDVHLSDDDKESSDLQFL